MSLTFWRYFGIWHCKVLGSKTPAGCGYTPEDAYRDWLSLTDAAADSAVN